MNPFCEFFPMTTPFFLFSLCSTMIMFILLSPVLRVSWSKQTEITERWVPGPSQGNSGSSLHVGRARGWDAVRWNSRDREQGLHFRSQHQFRAVCWLCGSPWITPGCCDTGSAATASLVPPAAPAADLAQAALLKTVCRGKKVSILDTPHPQPSEMRIISPFLVSMFSTWPHPSSGWIASKPSLRRVLLLWSRRVQQPWGGQPVPSCSTTLLADWYF